MSDGQKRRSIIPFTVNVNDEQNLYIGQRNNNNGFSIPLMIFFTPTYIALCAINFFKQRVRGVKYESYLHNNFQFK